MNCHLSDNTTLLRQKAARCRYLCLFAAVCGTSFIVLFFNNSINMIYSSNRSLFKNSFNSISNKRYFNSSEEFFTIHTDGCTIPGMKPFDDSVKGYWSKASLHSCYKANYSVIEKNRTHFWIKNENFKYHNVSEKEEEIVGCCYNIFSRAREIADVWSSSVDDRIKYDVNRGCVKFNDTVKVKNEFFKVQCKVKDRLVLEVFLAFATHKNLFELYGTSEMSSSKSKSVYNVIVLGIDSVSRLNFHRTMPKTLVFMKKKGAVELLGYNKIGSNSYPNIIGMLTGYKDIELEKICHPYRRSTFDFCPFVWHWYRKAGYYTAFGEDAARWGTFNYLADGFWRTPTDYYFHPYIKEVENVVLTSARMHLCLDQRYLYKVLLDYAEDVINTLRSKKLFGFFWEITMTHDDLNLPQIMDGDYEEFFKRMDDSNYLDESIIFLVSDHGIRWGGIRSTKQGGLEERLPFVFVLTPQSFRKKYSKAYQNLKQNAHRLTTPLDIHDTLVDLSDLEMLTNKRIVTRNSEFYANNRSISLFLPVPTNRTCKSAGIDDHWCTCHKGRSIEIESSEAVELAIQVIKQLNALLSEHKQCEKLKINKIIEAIQMEVQKPTDGKVEWDEYMVKVKTKPGGGVFEATLRHSSIWTLAGPVSRLNLYGNKSHCVDTPQLKLYCYCKHL